jgi:hypothetical protein
VAYVNFEEKEFEALLNADLIVGSASSQGSPRIFSPGQVLEAALGFDFSIHLPPSSRISSLIRGKFPSSKGIMPGGAAKANLPPSVHGSFLNLFLQYKRPQVFHPGHRSTLYQETERFLRFEVSQKKKINGSMQKVYAQVGALNKLESAFGKNASVQYVCPGLYTQDDLYRSFSNGTLLNDSVFVSPSQLRLSGSSGYHDYWTFQDGKLGSGIPNPGGPAGSSKNGGDFIRELSLGSAQTKRGVHEFAKNVAEVSEEFRKFSPWTESIGKEVVNEVLRQEEDSEELARRELSGVSATDVEPILEAVETASLARALGLTWVVVEV